MPLLSMRGIKYLYDKSIFSRSLRDVEQSFKNRIICVAPGENRTPTSFDQQILNIFQCTF
jgi:hypothetical protein